MVNDINELLLKDAIVESIDDKDKQGKIQIRLIPEGNGWSDKDLPWAIPFISNVATDTLSNNLPQEKSHIWILTDKYSQRFYYLPNRYFYDLFKYDKVDKLLGNLENCDTTYKNIKFEYFLDGSLQFHNNNDGSHGFIQNTGSWYYCDKDGTFNINGKKNTKINIDGDTELNIKGKSTIDIKNNTSVKVTGNYDNEVSGNLSFKSSASGMIEIGNAVATLGGILSELCQDLSSLTTVGSPATHTSPTLSAQMATLIPKIKMVLK